jgi:tetratricopeptide (TPR) repeat protein
MKSCLASVDDVSLRLRLLLKTARWAERHGFIDEAEQLYKNTGDAAVSAGDPEKYIQSLEELGELYRRCGRFKDAERCQNLALNSAQTHHIPQLAAHAMNNLGIIATEQGRLTPARDLFSNALDLLENDPEPLLEGHLYNNLGVLLCIEGRPEAAYPEFQRALTYRRQANDEKGFAETAHNLGMAMMDMGRFEDAEEHLGHALELSRKTKEKRLQGNILLSKAQLLLKLKLYPVALEYGKKALALLKRMRDPLGVSDAMRICGSALLEMNRLDAARTILNEGLQLASDHHHILGIAEIHEILMRVELRNAHTAEAEFHYKMSKKAFSQLRNEAAVARLDSTFRNQSS